MVLIKNLKITFKNFFFKKDISLIENKILKLKILWLS